MELLLPKSRPILTGVCYRPPNQMDFYECLERDCDSGGNLVDIDTVVLGDFNTNILKKNYLVNSLNNFVRMCGLN